MVILITLMCVTIQPFWCDVINTRVHTDCTHVNITNKHICVWAGAGKNESWADFPCKYGVWENFIWNPNVDERESVRLSFFPGWFKRNSFINTDCTHASNTHINTDCTHVSSSCEHPDDADVRNILNISSQKLGAPLLLCCVIACKIADSMQISNVRFVANFSDFPLLYPVSSYSWFIMNVNTYIHVSWRRCIFSTYMHI